MANTKDKASDPQDKKKVTSQKTINATEDASKKKMSIAEVDLDNTTPKEVIVENIYIFLNYILLPSFMFPNRDFHK